MEGGLLFPSGAELQKSLEGAACHRTVTQKHSIHTFKKKLLFFSEGGEYLTPKHKIKFSKPFLFYFIFLFHLMTFFYFIKIL